MGCLITSEDWQKFHDTGDARVARHLEVCATCRVEAARYTQLSSILALMTIEAPLAMKQRAFALQNTIGHQVFECAETLEVLEAWREGELDSTQSFLVEEHLLCCDSCNEALASADILATTFRNLPLLDSPVAIAARLQAARLPWWQQLLPTPMPVWSQQLRYATSLAAAILLVCGLLFLPAHKGETPGVNNIAKVINIPVSLPVPPIEFNSEPVMPQEKTSVEAETGVSRAPIPAKVRRPVVSQATVAGPVLPTTNLSTKTIATATTLPATAVSVETPPMPAVPSETVASIETGQPTEMNVSPRTYITAYAKKEAWADLDDSYSTAIANIHPASRNSAVTFSVSDQPSTL